MERCPHCRAPLPPPKTCPGCGETFYRGDGGRTDAACCSERCAARVRKRRERQKQTRGSLPVIAGAVPLINEIGSYAYDPPQAAPLAEPGAS